MPRGDFITRNSFYEALCAGSIPVVTDADYFQHCAFPTSIDYSRFVTILPEEEFMGDESKNVVELLSGGHTDAIAAERIHDLWRVSSSWNPCLQTCLCFDCSKLKLGSLRHMQNIIALCLSSSSHSSHAGALDVGESCFPVFAQSCARTDPI